MKLLISLLFMTGTLAYAQADDPLTRALRESEAPATSNSENPPMNQVPLKQSQVLESGMKKPEMKKQEPAAAQPKADSGPMKLTKEESELLKKRFRPLKDRPDILSEIEEDKKELNPVYTPSQARNKTNDGYVIERDSTKVVTKKVSVYDSINLRICFNAGAQIVLDEDISSTLQTIILDDKIFFDAISFDNNRGTYVRLKQPVPEGMYWESSVRMVRKDDDKTYLVNLIALPCPAGAYPFPKVVYLKNKFAMISKNTKVMTPENTIIGLSNGFPRVQNSIIRVRDMVASSGSEWVTFNVEMQFPKRKSTSFDKDIESYFKFLDHLQVSQLGFKVEYLPTQSEFVTKARNVPTMRFEIKVNIDKNYIVNNQFIYLMFVDKEEKYYQYVKIDTLPYFLSLKNRGFEL